MVNRANPINGQHIDRHPYSDQNADLGVYIKGASVIAAQAQIPGVVRTPEGEMTFQAGDWIVTDNPPTHAWPVRQQVFELTYTLEHKLEPGQYPTSEPVEKLPDPALSAPPPNAGQLKTDGVPEAAEATGNVGDRPPPAGETDVAADKAAALADAEGDFAKGVDFEVGPNSPAEDALVERTLPKGPDKPAKAPKGGRGIADSKSLGISE